MSKPTNLTEHLGIDKHENYPSNAQLMNKAIGRIIVGVALMVTPVVYHFLKMSGDAASNFQQSEILILFGREISKTQYFGLLGIIAVLGIFILSLGVKGTMNPNNDSE